jgi:hypothetical protein
VRPATTGATAWQSRADAQLHTCSNTTSHHIMPLHILSLAIGRQAMTLQIASHSEVVMVTVGGGRTHHLLQKLVGGECQRNGRHHLDVVGPQPLQSRGTRVRVRPCPSRQRLRCRPAGLHVAVASAVADSRAGLQWIDLTSFTCAPPALRACEHAAHAGRRHWLGRVLRYRFRHQAMEKAQQLQVPCHNSRGERSS